MALRTFTDRNGTEWRVWDITPGKEVRHSLAGGWLTFESEAAKRRLAPIPLYWVHAEDAELERLLADAKDVSRREAGGDAGDTGDAADHRYDDPGPFGP